MKKIQKLVRKFLPTNSRGFTLIEVLVVVAVMGVIGYVLSDLLTRSFRGSSKTSLVGTVKQNGQIAMDIMRQTIRQADRVLCTDVTGSQVVFRDKDGKYKRYHFVNPSGLVGGYIAEDVPTFTFSLAEPNAELKVCSDPSVTYTNEHSLTDSSQLSIPADSGKFNLVRGSGSPDLVDIQFNIGPVNGTGNFDTTLGGDGTIQLKSAVQLR